MPFRKGYSFWKNKNFTPEHCLNLSKSLKGRKSPRKGIILSEKTKQKIKFTDSKSIIKKWKDPIYREKQMKSRKNNPNYSGHFGKGKGRKKGFVHSEEHKKKLSKALKVIMNKPEMIEKLRIKALRLSH